MGIMQKQFADLITFTRAGAGGYWNWQGVYTMAAANERRIDHDPASVSLSTATVTLGAGQHTFTTTHAYQIGEWLRASADANNWMVGRVVAAGEGSVTIEVAAARVRGSGTYSSWTLIVRLGLLIEEQRTRLNTISAAPSAAQSVAVSAVAHTISFYGAGSVVLSGAHVASLTGAGAYPARREVTFTPTAGTLTITPTGDVRMLQLEAGAFATSAIVGEGAQVTRAADVASVNVLSPWLNASEGTLFVEVVPGQTTTANWAAALSNSATGLNDLIDLGWNWTSGTSRPTRGRVLTGGVTQTEQQIANTVASGQPIKMAIAYAANSVQTAARGVASAEDPSAVIPVVDRLQIGRVGAYGYSPGHIRSIRYYPKRLSNTEIQALTA